MTTSVSIIGLGVVGTAMYNSFIMKGVNIIATYDKYKEHKHGLAACARADIIFLCLPTPFKDNSFDKTELYATLKELKCHEAQGTIVIKSTVEPGTIDSLIKEYGLKLVHNPEFLTASTALNDFHCQTHIVIGCTCECELISFYEYYYPSAHISVCSPVESESMKLFINNFYAVKVQFFNELYLSCQDSGADFEKVREMMLRNGWINPQHTRVPGPDGQLSYGGMCFPKDTCALAAYLRVRGLPCEVIEAAISERVKIRKNDFSDKDI